MGFEISELENEDCLIELGQDRVILSFDNAYELALKLAAFLSESEFLAQCRRGRDLASIKAGDSPAFMETS